jgi:hypothetical protein
VPLFSVSFTFGYISPKLAVFLIHRVNLMGVKMGITPGVFGTFT